MLPDEAYYMQVLLQRPIMSNHKDTYGVSVVSLAPIITAKFCVQPLLKSQ